MYKERHAEMNFNATQKERDGKHENHCTQRTQESFRQEGTINDRFISIIRRRTFNICKGSSNFRQRSPILTDAQSHSHRRYGWILGRGASGSKRGRRTCPDFFSEDIWKRSEGGEKNVCKKTHSCSAPSVSICPHLWVPAPQKNSWVKSGVGKLPSVW